MTDTPNSQSHLSHRTVNPSTVQPAITAIGPYAQPVGQGQPVVAIDAVLIDAIRASAGPFVPAPLRGKPQFASSAISYRFEQTPTDKERMTTVDGDDADMSELPWIDAFIDSPVNASSVTSASDVDTEVADVAGDHDVHASWPLEDASDAIRALASEIAPTETSDATPDTVSAPSDMAHEVGTSLDIEALESALHAPLPMWHDDDLMDIMPVQTPASVSNDEHWAAQARREAVEDNYAEVAASLLEAVAGRIRDGSLVVSNTSPNMSDAVALSAALAALLSSRE